jgi:aerobic carbon-monoxide dehydrogenase medium subunit
MVGLAAAARREGSGASAKLTSLRLAFLGAGNTPVLASKAAAMVTGQVLSSGLISAAQQTLASELAPLDDLNAQAATKLHMAGVLLARVLRELAE